MSRTALDARGAELRPGFFTEAALRELEAEFAELNRAPGHRLTAHPKLAAWLSDHGVTTEMAATLGKAAQPVRALLFDKSSAANWSLGWHQDRTIAVKARHEVDGFRHWNVKSGITHVEPPFGLLDRMLTVRIHLDAVTANNGPLKIVPGSHRLGRIREAEIELLVESNAIENGLAERGDLWIYRTAILHASDAVTNLSGRRVLQVDYSADQLPAPLKWRGIF